SSSIPFAPCSHAFFIAEIVFSGASVSDPLCAKFIISINTPLLLQMVIRIGGFPPPFDFIILFISLLLKIILLLIIYSFHLLTFYICILTFSHDCICFLIG